MKFLETLAITSVNQGVNLPKQNSEAELLASYSPITEQLIAKIQLASTADYNAVVHNAETAFLSWRNVPAPKRGELVRQIGNELRQYKDALGSLVAYEMGKSKQEGDGEVQEMIDMADFAVGQSRMLYGKTMHSERTQHRMYEQWHPLGVVGILTAFNFPVSVWSWNAFLAAIAGDTVIWKPSPKTALCAIAVQKICDRVMKKNGYESIFNLFVTNDNNLAQHFAADTRIALISFTGSTEVGKTIAKIVSERLGRSLLELSGNNAIIVDETANLDLVVPAVVFGAVGTAGQRCTTTRRLIVHESIYAKLTQQLIHAYAQIKIGDPLQPGILMGPLIDAAAVTAFSNTVAEAKQQGGQILFGGKVINGTGYYVEPTIIAAENNWNVVQRENFAPILYVMKYRNFDDAIAMQNGVSQGLSSALFTQDVKRMEQYLSVNGSDCGIANINIGTSGAEIGGAFGGEKDTGGGRESGSDAWKAYMRRQTNTINWGNTLPLAQGIKFDLKNA